MIKNEQQIQLLDCTLRDGGLGFEDSNKYYSKPPSFSDKLLNSKIDIVELGSVEITEEDKTRFAIYQKLEDISSQLLNNKNNCAALYRGPDTPIDNIPNWKDSFCKKIRVIIRYSELKKSIDFCAELAKKGFDVIIQPMVTLRYQQEELNYMIDAANKMQAYALYFVDSYGYMIFNDIERLFVLYNTNLDKQIKIGFHAHNNMNLAFANACFFIKLATMTKREIIVDSTCCGVGQGAGNLQTELICSYLNNVYNKKYIFDNILEVCDIVDSFNPETVWGYSVYRFLPALYKTAYKYSVNMRLKYKLSYLTINKILKTMPDELRHRFTPENLDYLLSRETK